MIPDLNLLTTTYINRKTGATGERALSVNCLLLLWILINAFYYFLLHLLDLRIYPVVMSPLNWCVPFAGPLNWSV